MCTVPRPGVEVPAAGRAAGRLLLHGHRLADGQQPLRPPLLVVDLGPCEVPAVPLHPEAAHQAGPSLHCRPGGLFGHPLRSQGLGFSRYWCGIYVEH